MLGKAIHAAIGVTLVVIAVCCAAFEPALAHGEKAQPAAVRLSSVHWYDHEAHAKPVALSVNQDASITGKFHLSSVWPEKLAAPKLAILHTASPDPGMIRTRTQINGDLQTGPASLERGKSYAYRIDLRARNPGRFHIHPVLHLAGGASLIGPGHWFEVSGDVTEFIGGDGRAAAAEFGGAQFDIGGTEVRLIAWLIAVLLWIGLALIVWRRGSSSVGKRSGRANKSSSSVLLGHRSLQALFVSGTVAALLAANHFGAFDPGLFGKRLQGSVTIEPLPEPISPIAAEIKEASYSIPGRALALRISVRNDTETALTLAALTTSYVEFTNPDNQWGARVRQQASRQHLVVRGGPIEAGKTAMLEVLAQDVIWETERLADLEPSRVHRFSGLLQFFTPKGDRIMAETAGSMSLSYR